MFSAAIRKIKPIIFLPRKTAPFVLMVVVSMGQSVVRAQQSQPQRAQHEPANSSALDSQQQKPAPVTTTVVVHGDVNSDYLPQSVSVGALENQPLKSAPLSATVITRDLLNDQVSRLLGDVVKNDASIQDDYVPVGYYGVFQIRGFPLDLATGLKIDGMSIAGEQDVPFEDKERVEFLNGLAGIANGVAAGGGTINYITKPVAIVRAFELATDQYGTGYGAADLGRYFGGRKQVGARINLAGERIETYMNGTDGWRAVGAGAAEWKISDRSALLGNFEYQHRVQRDGSGYQLLGGTALPDINRIYRSTMLGQQSWAPPNTFDVFNTGVRFNQTISPLWTAFAAASLSHSLIDDNVIYAYGTSIDPSTYEPNCPNASDAPAYFFCPDGTYGIYDYRNTGELRTNAEAEAMISGQVKTGFATHFISAGGELFRRNVQMPGFYSVTDPLSPDGIVQDGAVYTYLGPENIYQSMIAFPIEDPVQKAGPRRLYVNSHQASFVLRDRMQLPGRIQLTAGGRYIALRDHNYSAWATDPCTPSTDPGPVNNPCPSGEVPTPVDPTDKPVWLPQFAATYNPVSCLTFYSNYSKLLSLGPQAPWWVNNSSQYLSPYNTRQFEAGAKYTPSQSILLSAAYFHMRAPFFYPKELSGKDVFCPDGAAGDLCFESQGKETHNGFEFNAQGNVTSWLRLSGSAAEISAKGTDTGTQAYDGKQVINVPRFRATIFADVRMPHWQGLYLMPGWSFTSRKQATRDDTVSVPAYNLFNLGLRYTPGGEQGRMTFRVFASNIGNKKYWSDTGASYGDTFLWLGAPTLIRASVRYTF
jgi:iron complex outermembrane receptor protein